VSGGTDVNREKSTEAGVQTAIRIRNANSSLQIFGLGDEWEENGEN
jgi:hypothetical protein